MKIVLASGASGGHIFPAASLAEELKKQKPPIQVIFLSGKKDIESKIFKTIDTGDVWTVESLPFLGFRSLLSMDFLIKLYKGYQEIIFLLKKEKPDLLIGFGGYVSFPAVMAAKRLGIKTMIHEQNVIPGTANQVLALCADHVATSFQNTKFKFLSTKKIFLTGNPIRSLIEREARVEACDFFQLQPNKKTLLVLGGSQGAESINRLFFEAMDALSEAFKGSIQVIHLCGKMAAQEAQDESAKRGVRSVAFSFFDRMDLAYSAADFVMGRAGATFLAEMDFRKIPSILIPYPYAKQHQRHNALAFSKNNQTVVLDQTGLTGQRLAKELEDKMCLWVSGHEKQKQSQAQAQRARVALADLAIRVGES